MLAAGHSEASTAEAVKVGRSTIQYWKRQDKFIELINNAQLILNTSLAKDTADDNVSMRMVLEGLKELQSDEAAIGQRLWALFDKLEAKTVALLEASEAEDFSPRQIPPMVKASIEIAQIGLTINDRVAGIGALVDGFKRVN